MKKFIVNAFPVLLLFIMFTLLAYAWGVRDRQNDISIQGINSILKIENVKHVAIFGYGGKWDISVTVSTPCGESNVKTGDMDNFDDAIKLAKEKIDCFSTCGGK